MRKSTYDKIALRYLPRGYDLAKLRRVQILLASRVKEIDIVDVDKVDLVCGLDLAYVRRGSIEIGIACAVVYSISRGELVDKSCVYTEVKFPYIPTLLSLRELRPMVMAYKRLSIEPEIVLVDGHGRAHPYRLGIASHLGVVLRKPTIGVAKSLLYGKLVPRPDGDLDILDEETSEIIGRAVRHDSKHVYVSVGNLVTLDSAVRLVKRLLLTCSQMPVPILYAHRLCNSEKRRAAKMRGVERIDKLLRDGDSEERR